MTQFKALWEVKAFEEMETVKGPFSFKLEGKKMTSYFKAGFDYPVPVSL